MHVGGGYSARVVDLMKHVAAVDAKVKAQSSHHSGSNLACNVVVFTSNN